MLDKVVAFCNRQHPFIWLVVAGVIIICLYSITGWVTEEGFKGGAGIDKTIYVTRVTSPADITRGLMFRDVPLGQNEGMLFDKGGWSNTGFWMKNTRIPLDIIFLDEEYRVIDILRDMVPGDLTVRSIDKPWRYAVEVNAGAHTDIKLGSGVNIIG